MGCRRMARTSLPSAGITRKSYSSMRHRKVRLTHGVPCHVNVEVSVRLYFLTLNALQ